MTQLEYAMIFSGLVVMAMAIRFIFMPFSHEYLRRRRIKKVLAELDKNTMDNAAIIRALKGVK